MVGISTNVNYSQLQFKANVDKKPINNVQESTLPTSDKTYRKNGKKVRKNMGWFLKSIVTLGTAAQCAAAYWGQIPSLMSDIAKTKADLYILQSSNKPDVELINKKKDYIERTSKKIAKNKKYGLAVGIIGAALGYGVCLYTNHRRDVKRAKLAAEPEQPTLDVKK